MQANLNNLTVNRNFSSPSSQAMHRSVLGDHWGIDLQHWPERTYLEVQPSSANAPAEYDITSSALSRSVPNERHGILNRGVKGKAGQRVADNSSDPIAALIGAIDGPDDWAAQHDHYLYG